jgi:hypothetical protein
MRELSVALHALLTDSKETPGPAVNLREKHAITAGLAVPTFAAIEGLPAPRGRPTFTTCLRQDEGAHAGRR